MPHYADFGGRSGENMCGQSGPRSDSNSGVPLTHLIKPRQPRRKPAFAQRRAPRRGQRAPRKGRTAGESPPSGRSDAESVRHGLSSGRFARSGPRRPRCPPLALRRASFSGLGFFAAAGRMASEVGSPKAREAVPGAGRAHHRTKPDVNESPPRLARGRHPRRHYRAWPPRTGARGVSGAGTDGCSSRRRGCLGSRGGRRPGLDRTQATARTGSRFGADVGS